MSSTTVDRVQILIKGIQSTRTSERNFCFRELATIFRRSQSHVKQLLESNPNIVSRFVDVLTGNSAQKDKTAAVSILRSISIHSADATDFILTTHITEITGTVPENGDETNCVIYSWFSRIANASFRWRDLILQTNLLSDVVDLAQSSRDHRSTAMCSAKASPHETALVTLICALVGGRPHPNTNLVPQSAYTTLKHVLCDARCDDQLGVSIAEVMRCNDAFRTHLLEHADEVLVVTSRCRPATQLALLHAFERCSNSELESLVTLGLVDFLAANDWFCDCVGQMEVKMLFYRLMEINENLVLASFSPCAKAVQDVNEMACSYLDPATLTAWSEYDVANWIGIQHVDFAEYGEGFFRQKIVGSQLMAATRESLEQRFDVLPQHSGFLIERIQEIAQKWFQINTSLKSNAKETNESDDDSSSESNIPQRLVDGGESVRPSMLDINKIPNIRQGGNDRSILSTSQEASANSTAPLDVEYLKEDGKGGQKHESDQPQINTALRQEACAGSSRSAAEDEGSVYSKFHTNDLDEKWFSAQRSDSDQEEAGEMADFNSLDETSQDTFVGEYIGQSDNRQIEEWMPSREELMRGDFSPRSEWAFVG